MTRGNIDGEDPPILLLVMLTFDTGSGSVTGTSVNINTRNRSILSDTKLSNIHKTTDKSINTIPNLVKQGHTHSQT